MRTSQTMPEFIDLLARATFEELHKYNLQDHTTIRMLKINFNKIDNKYLYHYATEVKQDLFLRAWTYAVLERGFKVLGEWDATNGGHLGNYIAVAITNKTLNLMNSMIRKNSMHFALTSLENETQDDAQDRRVFGENLQRVPRIDYEYVDYLKNNYATLKSQQAQLTNPNLIKSLQNKMDRLELQIKKELGDIKIQAISDTFDFLDSGLSIDEECEINDHNGLINNLMRELSTTQQIVLACLLSNISFSNIATELKIKNPKQFKKDLMSDIIDVLETRQWQMDDDFVNTFISLLNSTNYTMSHKNQNKGVELKQDIKNAITEHFDTIKANSLINHFSKELT